MELINSIILVSAILLVLSIVTSVIALRIGAPLLLFFLAIGVVAGPDGLAVVHFESVEAAYLIGSIALAIILFESGLDTPILSYRRAAAPALTLATVGVLITAGLVGIAAQFLFDLSRLEALLLGAVVASTDAAAVFLLLRVGGVTIRGRARSILEIESGTNDPVAIFLTLSLSGAIAAGSTAPGWSLLIDLLRQAGIGMALGAVGGGVIALALNRLRLDPGLLPIAALGLALLTFAATTDAGGSGFLAVYVAGLIVGNLPLRGRLGLRRFLSGLTWLSQIVMFVMLGVLATPSSFGPVLGPAIALSLFLILVARPLAVSLCLIPFRIGVAETTFIAWVGLRGAVSILLAIVPNLMALPQGSLFFAVAFIIVTVSLLVQGWMIRPMARWLRLIVPRRLGPVDRIELDLPGNADQELVAYSILEGSPVARGQRLPRWARPALVIRGGRVIPVHAARPWTVGDHVYLFAAPTRIPLLDRLYAGSRPLSEDDRDFFGDLAFHPGVTLGTLAELYGLPLTVENANRTLADLFDAEFQHAGEIGDRLRLGTVELIIRDMENGRIVKVGLSLQPDRKTSARLPLFEQPLAHLSRFAVATTRRWPWKRRAGKNRG
ncbi:MAG: potassium/proton antiporter [Azospirillaceae bacterium]|nr:potassium/proton antiporter [Azospirillaceae bacterium]